MAIGGALTTYYLLAVPIQSLLLATCKQPPAKKDYDRLP